MAMTDKAENKQVGGDHYKSFVIQPYQFCFQNKLNNLQSEVVSYVARYNRKWPDNRVKQLEDLKKAIHSVELLIEAEGLTEPVPNEFIEIDLKNDYTFGSYIGNTPEMKERRSANCAAVLGVYTWLLMVISVIGISVIFDVVMK